MANIINVDSLGFDDILADMEKYLTTSGELNLKSFHESSVLRRFTSALSGLYSQLRMKIESNRRESIMHSALLPDSIRYLAQSQLAYHPKRKIAPQHPKGEYFTFKPVENTALNQWSIIGDLSVGGDTHPISILKDFRKLSNGNVCCKLGIGSWREVKITVDENLGHLEPYHVFHIDEDTNIIDDSETVQIAFDTGNRAPHVVSHLYNLAELTDAQKKQVVLVTSNCNGGLDINFGDGIIFGNLLYYSDIASPTAPYTTRNFVIRYFVTPGFIPNLDFRLENISWNSNYVDESWFEISPINFNFRMANGIDEESVSSIKTLSPYVAMSNNRIMTVDDFLTRVRRIPQIKSCNCRAEHVEPVNMILEDSTRYPDNNIIRLVPTATFLLTALVQKLPSVSQDGSNALTSAEDLLTNVQAQLESYAQTVGSTLSITANTQEDAVPPAVRELMTQITNMPYIEDEAEMTASIETLLDHARTTLLNSTDGDNTVTDGALSALESIEDILSQSSENSSEVVEPQYHELDQFGWDLNFHSQYNFDTLLGFMRVKVIEPQSDVILFRLTVILRQNVDVNARSQLEIDNQIRGIINEYCYELGIFLDVGKIVADVVKIPEVQHCYLRSPLANKQYSASYYIKPESIDIEYRTTPVEADEFYRINSAEE